MGRVRVLGIAAALVLTLAVGVGLVLAGVRVLPLQTVRTFFDTGLGSILLIVLGALFLVIAAHYVLQLVEDRRSSSLFRHEGAEGRVDVSPSAIKELASGILMKEIGLDWFRVLLRHDENGVRISVRTMLASDQRVSDVGERIQRELTRRISDQTGVEVTSVTVLVRGIRNRSNGFSEVERDAE